MKTICVSIKQLENLLEVAKLRQDQRPDECTNIVKIRQVSPSDSVGASDKLDFYLESAWAECNDHFLGTN